MGGDNAFDQAFFVKKCADVASLPMLPRKQILGILPSTGEWSGIHRI